MKFKVPLIVVEDIDVSREFYEDVLEQKVINYYQLPWLQIIIDFFTILTVIKAWPIFLL